MQIKPVDRALLHHPQTGQKLKLTSVTLTGYRCLAQVELPGEQNGLADLPLGYHVYHPQLWNRDTDELFSYSQFHFTDLRKEYARAIDQPDQWTIIKKRPIRNAFILTCLDFVYGHCLSRLLNYTLDRKTRFPGLDCILMIPKQLLALAPEDCAEVWVYNGPLTNLNYRNLWLEKAFTDLYNRTESLYLSPASLPFPEQIDLSNHKLKPADIEAPTIIFAYRETRVWGGNLYNQRNRIEELGKLLSAVWDPQQLLLVGIGEKASKWRWKYWRSHVFAKSSEEIEAKFLEHYSHALLTIGCQGSNMLMPCLLSWSTLRFLTEDRLDHFLGGDFIGNSSATQIGTLFRHRMLYGDEELRDLSPKRVTAIAQSMIQYRHHLDARFSHLILGEEDYRQATNPIAIEEADGRAIRSRKGWLERRRKKLTKLRNRAEVALGQMKA
jgi:hypothetical protein